MMKRAAWSAAADRSSVGTRSAASSKPWPSWPHRRGCQWNVEGSGEASGRLAPGVTRTSPRPARARRRRAIRARNGASACTVVTPSMVNSGDATASASASASSTSVPMSVSRMILFIPSPLLPLLHHVPRGMPRAITAPGSPPGSREFSLARRRSGTTGSTSIPPAGSGQAAQRVPALPVRLCAYEFSGIWRLAY